MPSPSSPHDPALQLLPSPVVVVGAADGPSGAARPPAWVTQVSSAPALLAVAVSPLRHTHGLLRDGGVHRLVLLREGRWRSRAGSACGRGATSTEVAGHGLRHDGRQGARAAGRGPPAVPPDQPPPAGDHECWSGRCSFRGRRGRPRAADTRNRLRPARLKPVANDADSGILTLVEPASTTHPGRSPWPDCKRPTPCGPTKS
ncbi:MAG: flavin reductase [bacterium]|nr:flavin reductase [bacterium]